MVHIQCTIIALHIVEDRISLLWLATMMKEILFRFLTTALSVYKQFIVIESRRAKDDLELFRSANNKNTWQKMSS